MTIIGLSGYGRSGKDSVAAILVEQHGFTRVAFADKVREALYVLDPHVPCNDGMSCMSLRRLVDEYGWEDAKRENEVRRLMQAMGTELARKTWDEDFWVQRIFDGSVLGEKVVLSDVRFPNEADKIVLQGGEVWRVDRPGYGPVNSHLSEVALDGYGFDQRVLNDGSLDDLAAEVGRLLGAPYTGDEPWWDAGNA